ncbi:histone acetyltransferase KAT6B isoform X1 [Bombyx mori]|uniref:Uncharacterized protein n=1 Tax=Bombyx mori TaxID=7091 RepID=A0A8R2ATU7_BOMMO|nr:histone acetyltransferase KAT6B isoform X1 [Bombyx mori]
MNPPSAIHGAMNRDRKPFTYTPGGLDLSEIKSERMAKRLMRNAMNQGVPEVPTHPVQSPPMPSTPILVPNYNCLPVQVFPTFNLPANPKSLLRTRSNPDTPKDPSVQRVPPPYHFTNNNKESNIESYEPVSKPTFSFITTNNNRPTSAYEYVNNPYETVQTNNGCVGFKNPYELPEISYDAEYLTSSPIVSHVPSSEPFIKFQNKETDEIKNQNGEHADSVPKILTPDISVDALTESEKTADAEETSDDKKQVKFVSKTVKNELKIEEQNGDHNGDVEAEMTVKLPTKKTGAKTETRVEVVKKILPDGTVQEVKTTTTKTTIDGKTEIKTETETRTLPKEEADEEIEEFEEELEEQENADIAVQEVEEKSQIVEEPEVITKKIIKENTPETKEDNIIKGEEKSETTTTTTRKVVILQADSENSKEDVEEMVEEEVEEEEVEDSEPVTVVIKKTESITQNHNTKEEDEEEEEIEDEEVEEEEKEVIEEKVAKEEEIESAKENLDAEPEDDDQNEENRLEEAEEVVVSSKKITEVEQTPKSDDDDDGDDEVYEEAEQNEVEKEVEVITETVTAEEKKEAEEEDDDKSEVIVQVDVLKPSSVKYDEEEVNEECKDIETETAETVETKENNFSESSVRPSETKQETVVEIKIEEKEEAEPEKKTQIPMREPSVPLEKVEDVEIKPIGPAEVITKTHTEKTEIITRTSPVPGAFSTQTEYNRIEKIETVNRTTKTLDGTCEDPVQTEIPVIKTYFPPNRDRSLSSPMPSRPFQQAYNPEPTTERRHSLLLERLSVERQMPSEIYHNQNNEQQRQWSQEPQSEVLTISNVKPSSITNQQWYQQIRENSVYNDVTPTPVSSTPIWSQSQPKHQPSPQPQPQPQPQLQPTYRPQPTYPTNQTYTPQSTQKTITPQATQQTYASQPQQKIYTPQPIQRPYTPQPTTPILQSQYQPTYTETTQERSSNTYTSYTPKPTWASSIDTTPSFNLQQPSQYNYVNTETTDNYQKTSQQYSSSYVPPPWEQDSSYLANNSSQSYYQPLPTTTLTPTAPAQSWKPPVPKSKFAKPPPTAYIPPAPNQSFVKPVNAAEQSKQSGRKTYYSEYERRYISVPESTYIPTETKFQAQPDPSPQYYYDNNEQPEPVEHQWRKELREFTEKSQTQTEQTSVKPPWETESKFTKTAESTYTSTPTWSQTLRPRSWRERSFEREFTGSQEWPKTNTLGRSRPLSSYAKNEPILERTRGVSVDRYNPNNYQSPSSLEHPPVQSHTLIPAPHGTYHNPNVPNYHSRASTETREQATYKQPRTWREARPTPIQSRSFKYLQWITGTED